MPTAETQLKQVVKEYLKIKGYFWWWNLAGLGVFPGIPDICVAGKEKLFLIEFKAPKGKLNENQERFKQICANHAYLQWITCYSLDDVIPYL